MHSTPASLLDRLRRPNEADAWSHFVELYTPFLYGWACRHGLGETDAADLVQDVLLLLVRKLPDFEYRRDGSFRQWLRSVTLNKWRETQRRRQPGLSEVDVANLPAPAEDSRLEEVEYRRRLVQHALSRLRDEFYPSVWRLFDDHVGQGRSAQEVATQHGVTLGAVYAAKSKVLRRLRQELSGLVD
jgi:RNA polymerase sigma-70 factor (ECF subfamily)